MTIPAKPDILDTLERENIELKKRGRYYWALCPLHTEKTPSFEVNPEKQIFYCFGCRAKGDVIDFVMAYKGLDFKRTLSYLSINSNKREIRLDTEKIKKRELVNKYRQWLNDYTDFLCNVLRRLDIAKIKAKTMREVEAMTFHYHSEPIWEYHLEILLSKDEEMKFELYKGIRYGN